ncbi:MAG: Glu-tRNA(Gln) amidotransferase subunit GatE [Nanoarchaeota archaeon]|nr:Glu-tRNA(Gln) amidotransferase subunit GatE [Nanoarchaeota archaeon]
MPLDYHKLGFKAGIEIHQELNTKKLFCDCSGEMKEEKLLGSIERKIRSSAGETGTIDIASAFEHSKERTFVYQIYKGETCMVDLDEEPPHSVNKEALDIALGVAKALKLSIPDEICVMRKTVTDGSAISGFQRTILVGREGKDSFIETAKGKFKVTQLNLEEDSCKIVKKEGDKVFYSSSRLGLPLLEIGTDASLKDPEHVKEAALEIGTLLRSFNVKRGIGTIRQDVNVSIKEGARTEVKGWQELKKTELLVENEVQRQVSLLEIRSELHKRGLSALKEEPAIVTEMFRDCKSTIVSELIKNGGIAIALKLPKFSGLLKKTICPGRTFGRELADYARAFGSKGMIHTDEDIKKYNLVSEFDRLRLQLKAGEEDLIVIIAEKDSVARKAISAVRDRASQALLGVPEETRVPNNIDATSAYARPLPGANRLYPETDVRNIVVSESVLSEIKIPEMLKDRIGRLVKEYGIEEASAKELIREGIYLEESVRQYKNIEPKYLARFFLDIPKEIEKRFQKKVDAMKFSSRILPLLNEGRIIKEAVIMILLKLDEDESADLSAYIKIPDSELDLQIKAAIAEFGQLPEKAMLGKIMDRFRGRAEGSLVMEKVFKCIHKK